MKSKIFLLSTLVVVFLLSSCGGGDGGGGESDVASPADNDRDKDGVLNINDEFPDDPSEFLDSDQDGVGDNADTDVNGIWLGYTSNSENEYDSDTYGLFYDGEFVSLIVHFNEFYKGTYSIDQDAFSATGKGYAMNGPYGGTGIVSGVISSQGTLLASVEASIGTTSNLVLDYSSNLYERPISFADLEGSWSVSIPDLSHTVSIIDLSYNIAIDSSGYFIAVASNGCTASGNLEIPNPTKNMIKADLTISGVNCTVTGNYSGLGILADDGAMNDSIVFGYANDDHGFAYIAYRN